MTATVIYPRLSNLDWIRLAHLTVSAPVVASFLHVGDPVPYARSGANGKRHFTPDRQREHQASLAASFIHELMHVNGGVPLTGNLQIACVFFRATRRRVDGDNLLKLVLDAGTDARFWSDDSQLTGGRYDLELDRESPRTIVAVARHNSTLRR